MCGRYGFIPTSNFYSYYDLVSDNLNLKPSYNIAPSSVEPVIINEGGKKKVELMRWGLIPYWAKDIRIGNKMINARSEDVENKPAFRKPIRSQRCLVPANFFFEWMKTKDDKIPYLFKIKDQEFFSMAGMYDIVIDAEGKEIKSFTILTTEPNKLMLKVHNRMPVILMHKDEETWLNSDLVEPEKLLPLLKPYDDSGMESYPVSGLVNKPSNDSSDVIRPKTLT